MTITLATWNVNSVKSRAEHLQQYLSKPDAPDIVCLQELKCETDKFPYQIVDDCGYNHAVHGQKTYNGVAILSKFPIDEVSTTLDDERIDQNQSRFIEAVISCGTQAIRVTNVYVPNGQSVGSEKFNYKMSFYDALTHHVKKQLGYNEKYIVTGDFNVAPSDIDVFDPISLKDTVCFHPLEQAKWRNLENLGMIDAYRYTHPSRHQYSWWDYRGGAWQQNKGLRIDHLLLSPEAADICIQSDVDTSMRQLERPSDHAPVWASFSVDGE